MFILTHRTDQAPPAWPRLAPPIDLAAWHPRLFHPGEIEFLFGPRIHFRHNQVIRDSLGRLIERRRRVMERPLGT
jgi:hypothetical protein